MFLSVIERKCYERNVKDKINKSLHVFKVIPTPTMIQNLLVVGKEKTENG